MTENKTLLKDKDAERLEETNGKVIFYYLELYE